jgi:hypothetical protein
MLDWIAVLEYSYAILQIPDVANEARALTPARLRE